MDTIEYKIYIDDVVRRVETARLRVSGHHIVKTVAVSKYSTSDEVKNFMKSVSEPLARTRFKT